MKLKKLSIADKEIIKPFFAEVFTKEPWNDDWSDKNQLHSYMLDLIGCNISLTFGSNLSDATTSLYFLFFFN
mgnify:CR=1 FL=1